MLLADQPPIKEANIFLRPFKATRPGAYKQARGRYSSEQICLLQGIRYQQQLEHHLTKAYIGNTEGAGEGILITAGQPAEMDGRYSSTFIKARHTKA